MSIFAPATTASTPPEMLTPLLARRVKSAHHHAPSINAVDATVEWLRQMLDGHLSTDMVRIQHGSVTTETPSRDIARVDVGILPTGGRRTWESYGAFTPDAALGISLFFTDNYTYSPQNNPLPSGRLSLQIVIRSWGALTTGDAEEMTRIDGTSVTYATLGFDMAGTTIALTREEGHILHADELQYLLTPLIPHILDYFTLMHLTHPGDTQPHGNFSDRRKIRQNTDLLQNSSNFL